jgi:predicted ATP-dependent Lon-type protease
MSSTATGTLYRNITPTNIVFSTGSLSQSGVVYQSGVFYSSKKDVYAVISTDEIAKISFTGTNIGFPVSFWNQIETATGKYQSILPLTLTG